MESEINFLANLNHKNIIKYYGIKRTDDELSILLEYCIGIFLNDFKINFELNSKIINENFEVVQYQSYWECIKLYLKIS